MRGLRRTGLGMAAVAALLMLPAGPAFGQGQIITPTTFDDGVDPTGCTPAHCTLREALTPFNEVTVNLLPGTYELTMQQPILMTGVKTINGGGATIDANGASRVLFLQETTNSTINDVTITGGNATGNTPDGGGIYVQNPSTLQLNRSTVRGNRALTQGGGIFTESNGLVEIIDSTISDNVVGLELGGLGGGVYGTQFSDVKLFNSTVSGNRAPGLRTAAGISTLGALELVHVTIAGNVSSVTSLDVGTVAGAPVPPLTIWNTVVVSDSGPACSIAARTITGDHNLDDDGTCGFSKLGDKPGVNPLLGPLQNNGGPTQTQALVAGSPATNAADVPHCRPTDQRGVARPQQGTCDIGAFEYVPPLPPPLPPPPPPHDDQLPPPVAGKNVNASVKSGTVRIKLPGRRSFRRLTAAEQIPLGTTIDTLKGRVTLVAAANRQGGTATSDFYGGIFVVRQTGGARPITRLILSEKLTCPKSGKATTAAKRKRKRRLWGNGSGRFRTEGEYSSATVRGTQWLVEDRCTSTLTRVVRGRVAVRDFVKKKTIIVRRGKRYIARKA